MRCDEGDLIKDTVTDTYSFVCKMKKEARVTSLGARLVPSAVDVFPRRLGV